MKCTAILSMLCLGVVLASCEYFDGSPTDKVFKRTMQDSYAIDGVVDFEKMSKVQSANVEFVDQLGQGTTTGKTSDVRWAFDNDDRSLYIAIEWTDDTRNSDHDSSFGPTDFDGVRVIFDGDDDGIFEAGEDARTVIATFDASQYVDQHASSGDETDVIGDGQARLSYDAQQALYQAEFLIPRDADINDDDGELGKSVRYNIVLFDNVELQLGSGNVVSVFDSAEIGANTAGWQLQLLPNYAVKGHQDLPDDVDGLIAFASTHDEAKGEIYTYDPATGATTRITDDPTMYKDNVSLSHDRTRIAYHGALSKEDAASYEIYVVNVDGSGLTRLTNNAITDGHPAWSLEDDMILYASFRGGPGASLILMEPDGTELVDLTQGLFDDNDGDFLPDGRIVFKTNRFSTLPEVRLAVMDADGSNVEQLSFVDGVSEHDPVGDSTSVVWERFTKATNFATDPEAFFSPWDIVELDLTTLEEVTLLSDGYVNFLPVYDPSGEYICYIKNLGYAEARLMTRDGQDLGRLIPDVTRITYLDWK